jgi:Putative peptidoglycan binding domain
MKIPSWLDINTEITNPTKPEWFQVIARPRADAVFYLWSICSLFEAAETITFPRLNINQAVEITANFAVETRHGQEWSANNWGGVKINKPYVDSYKQKCGRTPSWFQSQGHVNSGDESVVYYVGFDSIPQFSEFWLERYVTAGYKAEESSTKKSRYYKTAKAFWENLNSPNQHWFYELCISGYKGPVTQKNPDPSVKTLFDTKSRIQKMVTQLLLGVTPDSSWGPKTTEACRVFQNQNNLKNKTGEYTDETLDLLVSSYLTNASFARKFGFGF